MWTLNGTPAILIEKRDGTRLFALLDPQDYSEARHHRWQMAGGKGSVGKYARNPELGYMHRWVADRAGLALADGLEVDHENGDKLDNRRMNLRLLRRPENMRNQNDGLNSRNTSGVRGVSFVAMRERFGKPWMAYVTVNYKTINLGWYATAVDAAAARHNWEVTHQS